MTINWNTVVTDLVIVAGTLGPAILYHRKTISNVAQALTEVLEALTKTPPDK